jgi:multidrug efflux pump subunit AcrB
VLFSLILAVGMLVDDAIIVTEFAERRMTEGMHRKEAFSLAAKRMAGPVVAATLTRVAAFSPLLFWPGIVGEFMKYMPITLIATLSASLLYALVFTPTLGAMFAKPTVEDGPSATGSTCASWRGRCGIRSSLFSSPLRHWSWCRWPTANTATASSSSPMSSPITAFSTSMREATCRSTRRTPRFAWSRTGARLARPDQRLYPCRQCRRRRQ